MEEPGEEGIFYSSSYQTHSRIGYFFLSVELLSKVKRCGYSSIVISDHATEFMEINLGFRFERHARWRLHVYLLQDFVTFVESCIDNYFELNTDETSASIRSEAFQAYIRGEMISFTNSKTKQHNQELQTLGNKMKKAETEMYRHNDPERDVIHPS